MNQRAKATSIPKRVKDSVWARDDHQCVICHSLYAFPEAHYIRRSRGGLGIEENIVTLCRRCHRIFDEGTPPQQEAYGLIIRAHLQRNYENWDEKDLIYKKEGIE